MSRDAARAAASNSYRRAPTLAITTPPASSAPIGAALRMPATRLRHRGLMRADSRRALGVTDSCGYPGPRAGVLGSTAADADNVGASILGRVRLRPCREQERAGCLGGRGRSAEI